MELVWARWRRRQRNARVRWGKPSSLARPASRQHHPHPQRAHILLWLQVAQPTKGSHAACVFRCLSETDGFAQRRIRFTQSL